MGGGEELNQDAAGELRALRAEIAVLREHVIALHAVPPHVQHAWLPHLSGGRLVLPVRHYRLKAWISHRSKAGPLPPGHISAQRRFSLWMTAAAGARMGVWVAAMALLVIYAAGLRGGFVLWFVHLSSLVIWVSFISYYCNFATDFAAFLAGTAALFSADTHTSVAVDRTAVVTEVQEAESDIARLADLQPGAEATALAASIRARLSGS